MKLPKRTLSAIVAAFGAVALTGCGGLSASKSVSPLDFILPGLVGSPQAPKAGPETPPKTSEDPAAPVLDIASVR